MLDSVTVEDLADAPPEYWPEMISRTAVVEEYIAEARPRSTAPEKYAARLGIGRRSFLRLVARRRARLAGAEAGWWQTGLGRSTSADHEAVIGQALSAAGAGARRTVVRDHVHRLSAASGRTPPSDAVIYARCAANRAHDAVALQGRLGFRSGIIVDACPLSVSTLNDHGGADPVWLMTAIDIEDGRIRVHRLGPQQALGGQLPPLVARAGMCGDHHATRDLLLTSIVAERLGPLAGARPAILPRARICPPDLLRAGEAVRMILGTRIGRIALRSPRHAPRLEEDVDPDVLEAVLGHLVEAHNRELAPSD